MLTAALKLGTKLRSALRTQTLDGQLIDYNSSNSEINLDLMDNIDLIKYMAQEEELRAQDLSTYKVVLTKAETRLVIVLIIYYRQAFHPWLHIRNDPAGNFANFFILLL